MREYRRKQRLEFERLKLQGKVRGFTEEAERSQRKFKHAREEMAGWNKEIDQYAKVISLKEKDKENLKEWARNRLVKVLEAGKK